MASEKPNVHSLTLAEYRQLEADGKITRPLTMTEPIGGGTASRRAADAFASIHAPTSSKAWRADELQADPTPTAAERGTDRRTT